MKKVWIAVVLIAGIFSVNFLYTLRLNSFSDKITVLTSQAASLADTDYAACGEYIDTLLEELDNSALLLYSFSSRAKVENIEMASKSAAEYYKFNNKAALKHELLMVQHRIDELKNSGKFSLKNLL